MSDTEPLFGFQSTLIKHPLDPLSPREVKIATLAVLAHVHAKGGSAAADEVRFIEVALKEPDKIRMMLASHPKGSPPPDRQALVIIWEKVSVMGLQAV
jgi:Cu2+-containing amine oxidase